MIKLVLFDFDGTIADTLDAGLDIYNQNAESQGFMRISSPEGLRNLSMAEFLRKFKIPIYKVPFFMRGIQARMNKEIDKVRLFTGMDKVIRDLSKGHTLGVLSSNSEPNIRKFLNAKKLQSYFQFVTSYNQLFGKASAIRKICSKYGMHLEDVMYIGDEVRDIVSTRRISVKMISVSWGYNSLQRLKKEHPQWIANQPKDIVRIINTIG